MNGTLSIGNIDLSNNDPLILEFRDIWYTNGSIKGRIGHVGGPLNGENASGAVIGIHPGYLEVIPEGIHTISDLPVDSFLSWNNTSDQNGTFSIEGIPFGENYTMIIVPDDWVRFNGTESGYIISTIHFSHPIDFNTSRYPDSEVNGTVTYYEYIQPARGSVFGTVRFENKGPLAGNVSEGVTISLFNESGEEIGVAISDENGNYSFEDIPFGDGYELRAIPPEEVLGINNNSTGYLFWDGSAFNHSGNTAYNISLKFYKYAPPEINHPKISIIGSDNDPLEDVKITVKIEDDTYTAFTNEFGVAEFTQYEGINFPDGTTFRAELEGYDSIKWDQGEGIPKMEEEEERKNDILLVWVLIGMIVVILIFGAILILSKRKKPIDEE
jgi:hypothetical protein